VAVRNNRGRLLAETPLWTVGTGRFDDVVGHTLVVYERPDSLSRSSTPRTPIACGVIEGP
jgi:hypothetical protein